MNESIFKGLLWLLALGFAAVFAVVVMPPLLENPDILGAALAGFVNPYAEEARTRMNSDLARIEVMRF